MRSRDAFYLSSVYLLVVPIIVAAEGPLIRNDTLRIYMPISVRSKTNRYDDNGQRDCKESSGGNSLPFSSR